MPLHLHLEKVLWNLVTPEVWKTGVLNQYASHQVFFYGITVDDTKRFRTSHKSGSAVRFDHIILDKSLTADKHDAVVVAWDLVVLDY